MNSVERTIALCEEKKDKKRTGAKPVKSRLFAGFHFSEASGTRTPDNLIKSQATNASTMRVFGFCTPKFTAKKTKKGTTEAVPSALSFS